MITTSRVYGKCIHPHALQHSMKDFIILSALHVALKAQHTRERAITADVVEEGTHSIL